MSRTLQFKRFPNSVVANTKGAPGELIIDTNNYIITVHNGNTFGGIRVATENSVSMVSGVANVGYAQAITAYVTAVNAQTLANTANNTANAAYVLAGQEPVGSQAYVQSSAALVLANSAYNQANTALNGYTQNAQSSNYTLQLSDAGKYLYYTPSSNVTLYLPTTANVAYTNGTTIIVVSQNTAVSANITVSPNTGVSLFTSGNTISGSHNVTPYGVATLMMVKANTWFMTGFGIS